MECLCGRHVPAPPCALNVPAGASTKSGPPSMAHGRSAPPTTGGLSTAGPNNNAQLADCQTEFRRTSPWKLPSTKLPPTSAHMGSAYRRTTGLPFDSFATRKPGRSPPWITLRRPASMPQRHAWWCSFWPIKGGSKRDGYRIEACCWDFLRTMPHCLVYTSDSILCRLSYLGGLRGVIGQFLEFRQERLGSMAHGGQRIRGRRACFFVAML